MSVIGFRSLPSEKSRFCHFHDFLWLLYSNLFQELPIISNGQAFSTNPRRNPRNWSSLKKFIGDRRLKSEPYIDLKILTLLGCIQHHIAMKTDPEPIWSIMAASDYPMSPSIRLPPSSSMFLFRKIELYLWKHGTSTTWPNGLKITGLTKPPFGSIGLRYIILLFLLISLT